MKRLLFLALLLVFSASAQAANKCVRAGAVGSGNGSDWTNAHTALPSPLVRGDTYYVADGTYAGYHFNTAESGTLVCTVKKATVAEHGPATGWDNTYGDGQAIFTQVQHNGGNACLLVGKSYFVFDGVTGGGPGSWTSNFGFRMYCPSDSPRFAGIMVGPFGHNIHDYTFRHFEVEGNGGGDGNSQTNMGGENNGVKIHDGPICWEAGGAGSKGTISYAWIRNMGGAILFYSCPNILTEYVYGGTFESTGAPHHEHGEFASVWHGDNHSQSAGYLLGGMVFRYNVVSYMVPTGGIIANTNGMLVYGNVFFRPTGVDFGSGAIGTFERQQGTKIYNNSFIDLYQTTGSYAIAGNPGSPLRLDGTFDSTGNEAKNNLYYSCGPVGYGGIPTRSYNHYVSGTFSSTGHAGESNATVVTDGVNPFVNYLNQSYGLNANTTPGTALAAPFDRDMNGTTRTTWTRGAIEFGGGGGPVPGTPVISVTPQTLDYGITFVGGDPFDKSITVTNSGTGTLADSATGDGTFVIRSGSPYNLGTGASTTVVVGWDPVAQGYHTGTYTFAGGGGSTVTAIGTAYTLHAIGTVDAPDMLMKAPFVLNGDDTVSQPSTVTAPADGGKLEFYFNVTDAGDYTVTGAVNCPSDTANSFFVTIDGEPISPAHVWNVPPTSGVQSRPVTHALDAAGSGSNTTKVWTLSVGTHRLVTRGKEGGAKIESYTVAKKTDTPPDPPDTPVGLTPADDATDVAITTELTWTASAGATTYDVYLDTVNPPALAPNGTAVPGSSTVLTARYTPPNPLAFETEYFWKIVAHNSDGSTSSAVQSFTTADAPEELDAPDFPFPTHAAINVPVDTILKFNGHQGAFYDIAFGTVNPPPTVSQANTVDHSPAAVTQYDPGVMNFGATYYWKVTLHLDEETEAGPVWSFTTVAAPQATPPPDTITVHVPQVIYIKP